LHGFQQVRCVNCVSDCLFKAAVDRFTVNIKSDGACRGKADEGAILAVLISVRPGVLVRFDIELCQKRELFERDIFILVTLNMSESSINSERGQGLDDRLDNIPVRLKCRIGDRIQQCSLGCDTCNESGIVCCKGTFK
jgi:hypothetical protein